MQTGGKTLAVLIASSMLSACGGGGGGTVGPTPPAVTTTFTTWRTDVAGKAIQVDGLGKQVSYTYDLANKRINTISTPQDVSASAVFTFDNASVLTGLFLSSAPTTLGFTAGPIPVLTANPDFVIAENTASRAIMSNPRSLAWDYQSFGVWESGLDTDHGYYGAVTLGARTADTAIPGSGTANFKGQVVGSYVTAGGLGNTVLATLNVGVDWGTRSLTLSTSGTQMSADGVTFSPNTGLNMTGTLNYSPGTNGFSGNLTTSATSTSPTGLTGNSTGQFYGPTAEELGGVFFLQGSGLETYSGAYGAKR